MDIFFKVSNKKLLDIRNRIVAERGIPALKKNGFVQSPFHSHWYGRNNLGDFTYTLCRMSKTFYLEMITIHLSRGDKWVKVFLNIFQLDPIPSSLDALEGSDGLNYSLPPNSLTRMRLRMDDRRTIPLFSYDSMFGGHRLKSFYSEQGLKKRAEQLGKLIEKDMTNIDSFIKRWHEIHRPNVTDWDGNLLPTDT
jgi:hypothetical protein